jgi:hypothetical protein
MHRPQRLIAEAVMTAGGGGRLAAAAQSARDHRRLAADLASCWDARAASPRVGLAHDWGVAGGFG